MTYNFFFIKWIYVATHFYINKSWQNAQRKSNKKCMRKLFQQCVHSTEVLKERTNFPSPPSPFSPSPTFYFPFLTPVGTAFSLIFSLGPIFKSSYLHVLFITIQHKYLTSAYFEFSLYYIRMIIKVLQLAQREWSQPVRTAINQKNGWECTERMIPVSKEVRTTIKVKKYREYRPSQ